MAATTIPSDMIHMIGLAIRLNSDHPMTYLAQLLKLVSACMVSPLPLLLCLIAVALMAQRLKVGRIVITAAIPSLYDVIYNVARLNNPTL